jgi:transposase
MYYFLAKHGIACEIIPANTVFRPGNERRIKTDRRDAIQIARMLKRREAKGIRIPGREEEAVRDYTRCRGDQVDAVITDEYRVSEPAVRR